MSEWKINFNVLHLFKDVATLGSCSASSLPNVIGKGRFAPIRDHYLNGSVAQLVCNKGHENVGVNSNTSCLNGVFEDNYFECASE